MEFLALLAIGAAGVVLIAPILAWSRAARVAREVESLRAQVAALGKLVAGLRHELDARAGTPLASRVPASAGASASATVASSPQAPASLTAAADLEGLASLIATTSPTAATAAAPAGAAGAPVAATLAGGTAGAQAALIVEAKAVAADDAAKGGTAGEGASGRGGGEGAATPGGPGRADSLEERIALVWLTRAGALAMLVGVAYFFKYVLDNDWIGPLGRVALGALLGVGILVAAEALRPRTRATYVHVLSGVGLAFLYLSAYASFGFYHLVPPGAAFAAVFVISLLGGALAVHHRAEPLLVLAEIAGFAAPVLLSSGQDNPLGLAAYLLVVSGGALAVSVQMDFRVAGWVAIAGTAALSAGWYERFFRIGEGSAYAPLQARLVPLAALALFCAAWLAAYEAARRRATLQPLYLVLVALLAAHAGLTALLFDQPVLLGALLTSVALLSVALLRREQHTELLVVPLLASFVLLLAITSREGVARLPLLGLLGAWAAIYAATFLREQLARAPQPGSVLDARMLWLACAVGLGFAVLAGLLLREAHPVAFRLLLVALSLGYVAIAVLFRLTEVALVAAALSLGALVAQGTAESDATMVLVAAAWALAYLAPTAWDVLARGRDLTPARLVVLSGAGLGFLGLALRQTGDGAPVLRAGLVAIVGAIDLLLGAALLKASRKQATVLLGQALALFCGAIALLLSGPSITLLWAAMGVVVATLAARERDRLWLLGAVAIFSAVACRLLGYDLEAPQEAFAQFMNTAGKEGTLQPRFLFNPRALAFAGSGIALLLSARAAARTQLDEFLRTAGGLVTAGHVALLFVVITESQALLVARPPPVPAGLAGGELQLYVSQFVAARAATTHAASVVLTLAMGAYAALLVCTGFALRERLHRFLGLGLFAVTLSKLLLWDVWQLPRIFQTLVLLGVGALLLGASFLYARFGKRLVAIFRDGAGPALLLALLWAGGAQALEPARFRDVRAIAGVTGPGMFRVELDPALFRRAQPGFTDLRIAGPDAAEVPYLVREVPVSEPAVQRPATMVDPVQLPGGAARAVFDLGRPGLRHSELRLELGGTDFIRRATVEISSDEQQYALIEGSARVFAVSGAEGARNTTLAYPVSDARYLRVTVLAGVDQQPLRILGGSVEYAVAASRPLMRELPLQLATSKPDAGFHESVFDFDLGEPGVPIERVALQIDTPAFERRATLRATDVPPYWMTVGSGLLYRAGEAESLTLPAASSSRRRFLVTVADGDDAPLAIRAATAQYRAVELVFRASAAGEHHLYIGGKNLAAPMYDLAAVLERAGSPMAATVSFGAIEANPLFSLQDEVAAGQPFTERHAAVLAVGLGAIVVALALWTVRLLRKAS